MGQHKELKSDSISRRGGVEHASFSRALWPKRMRTIKACWIRVRWLVRLQSSGKPGQIWKAPVVMWRRATFRSPAVSGAAYSSSSTQGMNRARASVVPDTRPAARLKMGWAGLLFLFKERPPPLLPGDTPGRTSVGAPDLCPHRPTYSALPPTLPCSACFFPSTGWGGGGGS